MGDPATLPGMLINGVISNRLAKGDIGKGLAINAALFAGAKGLGSLGAMGSSPMANTSGITYIPAQNVGNVGVEGLKQNIFSSGGSATGMTSGVGSAMAAPNPSLFNQFTGGLQSANTWANQNPVAASIGFQTASSLLAPEPPPAMAPPPGLMRGQQFQTEQPQMAMFQPQQISLI